MAEKADEDFERLCELASHEQDGEKLIAMTKKIITLFDAKHGKPSALPQPEK